LTHQENLEVLALMDAAGVNYAWIASGAPNVAQCDKTNEARYDYCGPAMNAWQASQVDAVAGDYSGWVAVR